MAIECNLPKLFRNWVFSALSSNIRNRVESQGQHATNQYHVDESTEVVSVTFASKWSSSNRCAALNPLVKMKSDRYLVMPKPIENIAVVLEGEDKGTRLLILHFFVHYKLIFIS